MKTCPICNEPLEENETQSCDDCKREVEIKTQQKISEYVMKKIG